MANVSSAHDNNPPYTVAELRTTCIRNRGAARKFYTRRHCCPRCAFMLLSLSCLLASRYVETVAERLSPALMISRSLTPLRGRSSACPLRNGPQVELHRWCITSRNTERTIPGRHAAEGLHTWHDTPQNLTNNVHCARVRATLAPRGLDFLFLRLGKYCFKHVSSPSTVRENNAQGETLCGPT